MVVCMRNAPQALAFGHLATSWGHCLGEFRRHGLARGSISCVMEFMPFLLLSVLRALALKT